MAETLNFDVVGIHNRICRFIDEAQLANSANVSQSSEYDVVRLKSYLAALRTYHDYVVSQPKLDLVETSPKVYTLKPRSELRGIENESLEDACRILEILDDEIVNSQSSRVASGLISFDSIRFLAIVGRCDRLVGEYIEKATPLDMPKTSPSDPRTDAGKGGI